MRWNFLKPEDSHELSMALAWEGDAYVEHFPGVSVLWLEDGFQEGRIRERSNVDIDKDAGSFADGLLQKLPNPCPLTIQEGRNSTQPPPEPTSKKELVDRMWQTAWAEAPGVPFDAARDARWAASIRERCMSLEDGWIAIIVGWAHADPSVANNRLGGLLNSSQFSVKSVHLGPKG